jgi:hypothetical protein
MSSVSLFLWRPIDFAALINRSTSSGRRYSRERTSAFLGRRKLSVFWRGVLCLTIDYSLNPLSSLPYKHSVLHSFYGKFNKPMDGAVRGFLILPRPAIDIDIDSNAAIITERLGFQARLHEVSFLFQ